jgi:hypothetical protein
MNKRGSIKFRVQTSVAQRFFCFFVAQAMLDNRRVWKCWNINSALGILFFQLIQLRSLLASDPSVSSFLHVASKKKSKKSSLIIRLHS